MKKKKKLTYQERVQIRVYLEFGLNPCQIAYKLDRSRSTISRELNKWGYDKEKHNWKDYEPSLAHWYVKEGNRIKLRDRNKIADNNQLRKIIIKKLKLRWSPQQISAWLKIEYHNNQKMNISHESIYKFIYTVARGELKKELVSSLRQSKKTRRSKVGKKTGESRIKDRVSIDSRPKEVDDRIVPGHWESDLIIGKDNKSALGTLVERTTRFLIIVPLKNKTAAEVRKAFQRELKKLPQELKKSMTHDNGLEMAEHKLFTKNTNINVFFCHPYSSWERATNENTNGLIRDFWPKKTDFREISKYQIKKVQKLLNERPRKVLNWKSPAEVFNNLVDNAA